MGEPVLEIAEISIRQGEEDAFIRGVRAAVPVFQSATGFRSLTLRRCIERPSVFRLMIEWDRIEDHTIGFRQSDGFTRWRELVGAYFANTPIVDHSHTVLKT
jgi:heme-degrading monooxygenase HmoA